MYYPFEDLEVWQEGMKLVEETYAEFKDCKDFALLSQIRRSAISIPSNIAEGYERQTNKEFIRYLYIASGSCGEFRTQLLLAMSLKYLEDTVGKEMIKRSTKLSSMINNLIKSRENM